MLTELYRKRKHVIKHPTFDPSYNKLTPVDSVNDGVITKSSEFKKTCVEDNNKQFTYQDFSLGNIIATGSEHMLKPCSMQNHDVAGIGDTLDKIAENFTQVSND